MAVKAHTPQDEPKSTRHGRHEEGATDEQQVQNANSHDPFGRRLSIAEEGAGGDNQTDGSERTQDMNAISRSLHQSASNLALEAPRIYVGPGWYEARGSSDRIIHLSNDQINGNPYLKAVPWQGVQPFWIEETDAERRVVRHLPQAFVDEMLRLAKDNIPSDPGAETFSFEMNDGRMSPTITKGESVQIAPANSFTGDGIYLIECFGTQRLYRVIATPAGLLYDEDDLGLRAEFRTPDDFAKEVIGRVLEPVDLRVKGYIDVFPLDRVYIWHDKQNKVTLSFTGQFRDRRSLLAAASPYHAPDPVFIATFPDGTPIELLGCELDNCLSAEAQDGSDTVQALINRHRNATKHWGPEEMAAAVELAIESKRLDDVGDEQGENDWTAINQYADLDNARHVAALLSLPRDALDRLKASYDADGLASR